MKRYNEEVREARKKILAYLIYSLLVLVIMSVFMLLNSIFYFGVNPVSEEDYRLEEQENTLNQELSHVIINLKLFEIDGKIMIFKFGILHKEILILGLSDILNFAILYTGYIILFCILLILYLYKKHKNAYKNCITKDF